MAFLAALQSVVAKPSPNIGTQVTTDPKYEVLDIIPAGNLNITLYERKSLAFLRPIY